MSSPTPRPVWVARCRRCGWQIESAREEWAQAAGWDHRRKAHAFVDREASRERYRFRGRLNATQQELLRMAAAGTLPCHQTRMVTHDATGNPTGESVVWCPDDVRHPRAGRLWVPGLVDAGFLVPRPTWKRQGLYRLTRAGADQLALGDQHESSQLLF